MQATRMAVMALVFLAMLVAVALGLFVRYSRQLEEVEARHAIERLRLDRELGAARTELGASRLPTAAAAEQVAQLAAGVADLEARITEVKRYHELSRKETETGLERLSVEVAKLRSQLQDIQGSLSMSLEDPSRVGPAQ